MSDGGAGTDHRLDGIFIDVEVDESVAGDAALAAELEEVCPVDIFAAEDGVRIVRENVDECVLCELCIEAAPPGAVVVRKLYDGSELRRSP
jgi:NAD-dependent dihydropyrimidine dehydrogenase PreA subunit